ncbi:hypothetical protein M0R45_001915 [Rubus argutus]|uniref:Uncharacterized protein n=1 Tax=Rubus argutus TaxID=59490 RepID=A0AAW1VKS6_RUBAR
MFRCCWVYTKLLWLLSDDDTVLGLKVFGLNMRVVKLLYMLVNWEIQSSGSREIEVIHGQLQSLLFEPQSLDNQQAANVLSSRLEALLTDDHEYWLQRSKIAWLSEGDRNTKFFHQKASNRRTKNRLTGLFENHGVWQSIDSDLKTVVIDYFSLCFAQRTLIPLTCTLWLI